MKVKNTERMTTGALLVSVAIAASLATGCSKGLEATSNPSSDVVVTSDKPSTVLNVIDQAVSELGDHMNDSGVSSKVSNKVKQAIVGCSEHAQPLENDGSSMDRANPDFPARTIFCKLSLNTGDADTVRGAFSSIKAISCMIEQAGIPWDGLPHVITGKIDSKCFSPQQIAGIGVAQVTATVTASKPAAFNAYYDNGIVIDIPGMGTHKLAVKKEKHLVEVLAVQDSSVSADKSSAYAASLNSKTGELRFESRNDRLLCNEVSSCGFSRHERFYALLVLAGEVIVGINDFEGIATSISNYNGQYSGEVSTLTGNLNTGMKGRYFGVTSVTSNDLADAANYVEVVNNRCYTYLTQNANCGANTGLVLPNSGLLPFTLHPAAGSTDPITWANGIIGLTFQEVDFSDVQ